MAQRADPFQETDAQARALARALLQDALFAALAFLDPDTAAPCISRIGFGLSADGAPLSLISDLATHSGALRHDPRAALLLGEPASRGDPLASPRLSLQGVAEFIAADSTDRPDLRSLWLDRHPKSKLYIDFADFSFVRFKVTAAALYGGFGRAYRLAPADLE